MGPEEALTPYLAEAFGLSWRSDIPLVQFASLVPSAATSAVDIDVRRVAALTPRASAIPVRRGQVHADGFRFPWQHQVIFDAFAGERVDYLPLDHWPGALPHAFYGTVVALLLAWRGVVPMHACAVEVKGSAVLIAGEAGAGKSSLLAGLLDMGAKLVSDDLTAIVPGADGVAAVLPGRTTVRLSPEVSRWAEGRDLLLPISDTRGKQVLVPPARTAMARIPLAGLIVLGNGATEPGLPERGALLTRHLFRPTWLRALPNHRERQRLLVGLAARLPIVGFPAVAGGGEVAHRGRATEAMKLAEMLVHETPRHQAMNSAATTVS